MAVNLNLGKGKYDIPVPLMPINMASNMQEGGEGRIKLPRETIAFPNYCR